jgi:hypothetical protein
MLLSFPYVFPIKISKLKALYIREYCMDPDVISPVLTSTAIATKLEAFIAAVFKETKC